MCTKRLSKRDAREYLHTVKDKFQDNREIYDIFIKILNDFHSKRIGHSEVKSKVVELFNGHEDLLLGFNQFLPECFKIILMSDSLLKTPKYREAREFVNKVKATLQDDAAYKSFLDILKLHREGRKSITEVYHEVLGVLFRDHHDLCVGFAYFLPR